MKRDWLITLALALAVGALSLLMSKWLPDNHHPASPSPIQWVLVLIFAVWAQAFAPVARRFTALVVAGMILNFGSILAAGYVMNFIPVGGRYLASGGDFMVGVGLTGWTFYYVREIACHPRIWLLGEPQ